MDPQPAQIRIPFNVLRMHGAECTGIACDCSGNPCAKPMLPRACRPLYAIIEAHDWSQGRQAADRISLGLLVQGCRAGGGSGGVRPGSQLPHLSRRPVGDGAGADAAPPLAHRCSHWPGLRRLAAGRRRTVAGGPVRTVVLRRPLSLPGGVVRGWAGGPRHRPEGRGGTAQTRIRAGGGKQRAARLPQRTRCIPRRFSSVSP